jgi:N12 class adenine-specific DNA methylase
MVAAAMELKRLGLCHKAMAVVPNHLPAQWEAEARRLYPDINALAPSKEELSASQRGELLSRVATGNWDLIILPHTAFKMLPVAQETIARYIQREIDTLREYLGNIPKDERNDHRRTIKEIERSIKMLEVKLKDCESAIMRDSKHTITWEELGVDMIMVDECHLYKNLYCPTKMRNVAGLPTADSQRAFDAFIKVRSLLDNGGRVVFATATPVSNTLAEVYVMMKFLQLDILEELGIAHFDAWVQLFAETSQGLEMKPDASGFRIATRFNKFTNLPELAVLWRQVLDVKNADQINLPRPRIAGGAPQVITIPTSPEIKQFIKKLATRVEAIKSRRVSPDVDNMLRITTEGRKAALDIRLVASDAPPPAYSKIDALADKVLEFYRLSQKDRGAQVVFCDLVNCRPLR